MSTLVAEPPAADALTHAQLDVWLLHHASEDTAVCNEGVTLRLTGALDTAALSRALSRVVQRHAPLRTAFLGDVTAPRPVPRDLADVPLAYTDLSSVPAAEREVRREQAECSVVEHRFALDQPPGLRAVLLREDARVHTLAIGCHRLCADTASVVRLLPRELLAHYAAQVAGTGSDDTPPPVGYGDFAAWEAEQVSGAGCAAHLGFWQSYLDGAPPGLNLPGFAASAAHTPSYRGLRVHHTLDAALTGRLNDQAALRGLAVDDLLFAAWTATLGRLADQPELVVGTPVSHRETPGFDTVIGCLSHIVPLRVRVDPAQTLVALAGEIAVQRRAIRPHSRMPGRVIAQAGLAAPVSPRTLYRVLFDVLALDEASVPCAGLEVDIQRIEPPGAVADLCLEVAVGAQTRLALAWRSGLLPTATAERLLRGVRTLLEAALREPLTPVAQLPLIDAAQASLLAQWAGPPLRPPPLRPVPAQLVEAAARCPGDIALVDVPGGRALTYGELFAGVDALAQGLRARGVGPGARVALWLSDPAEAVQSLLAVLLAGGAYVPINPRFPAQRVAALVADSAPVLLIVDDSLRPQAPTGVSVATFRRLMGARDGAAESGPYLARPPARALVVHAEPAPAASLHDPAYVMYTSGSTGEPKGVVVSHANLAHQLAARQQAYDLPPDCFILLYSLGFDSSVAGLFWALAHGARIVLPDETARRDPEAICAAVAAHGVTHLDCVPSMHNAILAAARPGQLDPLRLAVVGGEALSRNLVELHRARLPWVRLYNEYGPTEATVFATVAELTGEVLRDLVPIGRPIAGTRCHVLDAQAQAVPIGLSGELWISGPGVAVGYLHRPDQTAERFRADPHGPAGARMYRSGDRVRWRDDGQLDFLGRVDRQVKVRGYRIELEEIQSVIGLLPGVQEAAVVLREAVPGEARIVAFVVPTSPGALDVRVLRQQLRERLPDAMLPSEIGVVAQLARTANGKLDLAALPASATSDADDSPLTAPRTDTERRLAALFERLLRLPRVGIDDDFFALGGHSLLAVQLARGIQQDLKLPCSLRTLFEAPTIRALAPALQAGPVQENNRAFPLQSQGIGPGLFCVCGVFLYQALADRMKPDTRVYGVFLPPEEALYHLLETPGVPPLTVEAMATDYLRVVRAQQPYGPYRLAGLSFGGLLAYEMAQQLRRQGERVDLLVVMDTLLPQLMQPNAVVRRARIWARAALALAARPWRRRGGALSPESMNADAAERERLDAARLAVYERAMALYKPMPYAGPVLLMRALDATPGHKPPRNPTYGWESVVSQLHTYVVPGDHLSILERPNVDQLAHYIRSHLAG